MLSSKVDGSISACLPAWFMAVLVAGQRQTGKLANDSMVTISMAHLQPRTWCKECVKAVKSRA
jgi:hypothetical protein